MSLNNGQRLLVFGLGFAQHDNRKMQQILRHYNKLPNNPGSRAALFVELNQLAKELTADTTADDQVQQLTDWIKNGGEFPLGMAPGPKPSNDEDVDDTSLEPSEYGRVHRAKDFHYHRYGRGRTLDGEMEGTGDTQGPSSDIIMERVGEEGAHDQDSDDPDDVNMAEVEHHFPTQDPHRSSPDEDSEDLADGTSEDTGAHGWPNSENPEHVDGERFWGRGRALSSVEEAASTSRNLENEPGTAPRAPPANGANSGDRIIIPQLHRNQAWRGDNVVGLANILGHPHFPIPGRRVVQADREDDDWGFGRHHFGLGQGRTLNNPEPIPDQGGNQDLPTDQHSNGNESDEDDSIAEMERPLPFSESNDATDILDEMEADEIECPICIGQYPPCLFPRRATITELCDHPDKACLQCIAASIAETMKRGALHLLACPICPQKLTPEDVREYAGKELYGRYKYLKQQSEIPGHWISCTNPSCGGSQPHDSKGHDGPRMVCKHCQFETCAKHRRPWHGGQTCAEFDLDPAQIERLEEEEATAKLLSREATSICPKCGQGVTKTDGCDHMQCQCGTEWCYVVSGHFAHEIDTRHRNSRLTVIIVSLSALVRGRTSSASETLPTPPFAFTIRTKST